LISLKAAHCLADVMRELKKASSVWVHDVLAEKNFAWQEGYAALHRQRVSTERGHEIY